jgi:arginyl-tRNA synthetase
VITEELQGLLGEALDRLRAGDYLDTEPTPPITLERPARREHGDFSTNIALILGSNLERPPREIAKRVVEALPGSDIVEKVEVAGPGFINFYLSRHWLHEVVRQVAEDGERYGRSDVGSGRRIQVEYGSPNPTGPITVGNARNIVYGDALASLLKYSGFEVERENYLNDAGNQVQAFGHSLMARYREAIGMDSDMPDEGYEGSYLIDMGKELAAEVGKDLVDDPEAILRRGIDRVVERQKKTLERLGVVYDSWVSQRWLLDEGRVDSVLDRLRSEDVLYEEDGAWWFKASEFGHSKDQVLIRRPEKGGTPTYLAADAAYVLYKVERDFDRVVYFWGADHHNTAGALMALATALEVDQHVEIIIYQFVTFEGRKFSKRSGEFITLDEMIDEVGVDATRFTFLTRGPDTSMVFDFDLVKSQSMENPVYYVQYAHARICSILRKAEEGGVHLKPVSEVAVERLQHDAEVELMRKLAEFPETVEISAHLRAPYRLTAFARELAEQWHLFYENCRVIGEEEEITQARLWLAQGTRQVLANSLAVLGVSAPERM